MCRFAAITGTTGTTGQRRIYAGATATVGSICDGASRTDL